MWKYYLGFLGICAFISLLWSETFLSEKFIAGTILLFLWGFMGFWWFTAAESLQE